MKKILMLFGIIFVITVVVTVAYAENNPKIRFMDNDYLLKWSNIVDNKGFINEYLTNGENFENYHTMITVHNYTNINDKDSVANALYQTFKKNGIVKMSKIDENANYLKFCALALVPVKHIECSYYNVQNSADKKSVMVFQFTKRYYPSEIENSTVMGKMMVDDEEIYKPYVDMIKMPKIIKKVITAPASYMYGVVQPKNN